MRHWSHNPRNVLLAVATVTGFAARLTLAWYSAGTNDADAWRKFAGAVNEHGLFSAYWRYPTLNHPPVPVLWAGAALRVSAVVGVGFEFIFKLPAILADAGSCLLLAVIWTRRRDGHAGRLAAAIFALSPIAILIGAYHCNTDNIYAFVCLLATYLAAQRRFLPAGLALAAAINVKLIPVLLILPLMSLARDPREAIRFIGGLSIGVIPFIPVLLGAGEHFGRNALAYTPQANRWGIAFVLHELHLHENTRRFALDAMRFYFENGRYFIFAAVGLLSFFSFSRRRWDPYALASMSFALFLLLSPGFGIQYLVILAPLLLAANLRWGTAYGLLAGAFAFAIYGQNWTGTIPLYSFFDGPFPYPAALLGATAWGVILAYVVASLRYWKFAERG